jgi:predicted nucleic acid-binding protein
MSQPNITSHSTEEERGRETAQARADLERRAAEQGIKPFDADEWLAGLETDQTPEEVRQEIDEFLHIVREVRDTPSSRSIS